MCATAGNADNGGVARLKLAFVGCGAISEYHLAAAEANSDRIELTAAIDRNRDKARRIADASGAEVFTSFEDALIHGRFDAVDLMLPHDLHESAAIAAFEAGKHVLLEKPMAPTLEACNRIMAAANRAGTVFMMGENAQYWPEVVKAQQLLHAGAIGEVITAHANLNFQFDKRWFAGPNPWRFAEEHAGGGIAMDGGSHRIRALRMWMGEIDEVAAMLDHPLKAMKVESLVRALLRFKSGKLATFSAMMVDHPVGPEPGFSVTGTRGQLVIDSGPCGALWQFDPDHSKGILVQEPQGYNKSFAPELADFARAVLDGRPPAAGPEQSLGELRTALAIYRSAATRQWEKVWT